MIPKHQASPETLGGPVIADVLVIGAGAVGVSAAYHLAQEGVEVAVIEKEPGPAFHQSGRNSGVIHAGYNLKPGSLKARYCIEGNRQLRDYCHDKDVPVTEGGILIVGQTDSDVDVLKELERRGLANGTPVTMLGENDLKQVEPTVRGIAGLQATDGASIDARAYVQRLASDANQSGAKLFYDRSVTSIDEHGEYATVATHKGDLKAAVVINAAGLYADQLAGNLSDDMRVIPFRGYYAELIPQKTHMVRSHVYATPDLDFPFLGIHFSKRTDGRVIVGPGAMLAFGKEAYSFFSAAGGGTERMLEWPGFYKMLARPEFRNLLRREVKKSLMISAIGKEAMQLIPDLSKGDFVRSYAGNRAQLVDKHGQLVDDIVIRESERVLHVLNVVSPGLTCSLPFGKYLAERALQKL